MDSYGLGCCSSILFIMEFIGFIIIVAIIYSNDRRLKKLEDAVRKLGGYIPEEEKIVSPPKKVPEPETQQEKTPATQDKVIPDDSAQQVITDKEPSTPEPAKSQPKELNFKDYETFLAGKIFNILGSIILVIGVGFFLKYAFDNHWINETLWVLMGGAFGAGLLIGGWHCYKKDYAIVAQGLIGTGISVFYLSIYSAYQFYHLIPGMVAFGLMIITTVIAFQQALKYDAPVISFLGLIGGFLTPFLLATKEGSLNELLIYITLLNAGIFAIIYKKDNWRLLELFSIGATFITFFAVNSYYGCEYNNSKSIFLIVFWLIYSGIDSSRPLRSINTNTFLDYCTPIVNAAMFYCAVYSVYEPTDINIAAVIIIVIALINIAFDSYLRKSNIPSDGYYKKTVLIAMTYIFLATGILYQDHITVILWMLEGLAALWMGIHIKKDFIWKAALVVYSLAILKMFFIIDNWWMVDLNSFIPIFNIRVLTYLVIVATLYFSYWIINKSEIASKDLIRSIFQYIGGTLLFVMITTEVNDYFSKELCLTKDYLIREAIVYNKMLSIDLVCGLYAVPLFWLGIKRKIFPFVILGFAGLFIGLILNIGVSSFYTPIQSFELFINARFIISVIFIMAFIVAHNLLKDAIADNPVYETVANVFKVLICLIIFMLLSAESSTYFAKEINQASKTSGYIVEDIESQKQFVLSIAWTIYAILLMGWGILKHSKVIRIMSIILFIITILKVFIIDLSFMDSLLRIISFIALGAVLMFASFLYQKYKHLIIDFDDKE